MIFLVMIVCGLADGYQSFGVTDCLHIQGKTEQKMKMEAAVSSGTITIRKSTRWHNPMYHKVNLGLRENFESNVKFGCKHWGTQENERSRNLWVLKWIWGNGIWGLNWFRITLVGSDFQHYTTRGDGRQQDFLGGGNLLTDLFLLII
jgi:hypothetical protein